MPASVHLKRKAYNGQQIPYPQRRHLPYRQKPLPSPPLTDEAEVEDFQLARPSAHPNLETSGRKIMRRRVKSRRTKAVIKHAHRGSVLDPGSIPVKEEHRSDAVPPALEKIIRKPLNTAQRKSKRKSQSQRNHLLSFLASRLQASNHFYGRLIRPHALVDWLEKDDPYTADYLLEHAENLSYEDGKDSSDPLFGAELDAIMTRFASSGFQQPTTVKDSFEVPKDYGMILTPFAASGHADHEAMMVFEDEKSSFMSRLTSGRRPSKAMSETDTEDEEMLDALAKHIRSSQSQPNLDTVIEEESDEEGDAAMDVQPSTPQHSNASFKPQRGFDAVQVLKKHAIGFDTLSSLTACNLDIAIHPIFQENNFHDCPQYIYDALRPGLRLCTLLLTHRATSSFWHTLCFGERTTTANHAVKRIIKDVPWTESQAAEYARQLQLFAQSIHFHFGLFPTPKHTMEYSYASMHPIKDHLLGWQPKPGEPCRRSRIRLHTDFYTTARKLSKLRSPDPAQVLRFNFFFAVNLAHELAHFLWMSSWSIRRLDVYSFDTKILAVDAEPEPYFNDQAFNELGAAFETKIFGGRIEPISCRVDCAYGLTTSDQPAHTDPHPTRTFYTIPMDYIARMQQQSTWNDLDENVAEHDWTVFHIPRNGAKSVSVPYFDMTIWRDEAIDGKISDKNQKHVRTPFKRLEDGIVKAEELEKQQ